MIKEELREIDARTNQLIKQIIHFALEKEKNEIVIMDALCRSFGIMTITTCKNNPEEKDFVLYAFNRYNEMLKQYVEANSKVLHCGPDDEAAE